MRGDYILQLTDRRHTQHNYSSKVTSLGLVTGHHRNYTYQNMSKGREKEISTLTQVYETGKIAHGGQKNVKLELPNFTLLFTNWMQFYQFYIQLCVA